MPWKEVTIPLQRLESATLATAEGANRRRLCRRSGISPKTGCKWLHRFQEGEPGALQARSRRLHHSQQPDADNSILWGNTASAGAQIYNHGSITPTITHSLVQGRCPSGATCDHILDAHPQFVDADGPDDIVGTLDDDLRLQDISPAIDAAHNTALPPDTLDLDGDGDTDEKLPLDLDGNPRIVCIVDMGAYEAKETTICTEKSYLPLVMKSYAP